MESKSERAKRIFDEMPFEDRLSRFVSRSIEKFSLYYSPALIMSANSNGRREKTYEFIETFNYRPFDDKLHQPGSADYDMVIIKHIDSPVHLYKIFYDHNSKFILFDTDKIFSSKWYIEIVKGAICVSPDSVNKWTIDKNGQKSFTFKGRTMFLTNLSESYFMSDSRYDLLLRDTRCHL